MPTARSTVPHDGSGGEAAAFDLAHGRHGRAGDAVTARNGRGVDRVSDDAAGSTMPSRNVVGRTKGKAARWRIVEVLSL
jgi:hypothetical protein